MWRPAKQGQRKNKGFQQFSYLTQPLLCWIDSCHWSAKKICSPPPHPFSSSSGQILQGGNSGRTNSAPWSGPTGSTDFSTQCKNWQMIKLPASLQLWLAFLNPFTVALYKRFYITWLYFFPSKLVFSVLVAQLCPTLCNPMDCSLPGSSVHGIFQARILEWVAISFSRGSSQSKNQTQVSCIAGRFFTLWATGKVSPSSKRKAYICVCVCI